MASLMSYILPLAFFVSFALIAMAVRAAKKRLFDELYLIPTIEEICGVRINSINYTWPFVRHSIYKEFIVIKYLGNGYVIPRFNLNIANVDGIISTGIKYTSADYPGYEFRVWTTKREAALKELENKL